MGFFSSRKPHEQDDLAVLPPSSTPDKSVVQTLRSRFYPKNKGKERETFLSTGASVAQTLSNAPPTPSPLRTTPSSSILRSTTNTTNNSHNRDHPLPATPAKKKASFDLPPPPLPSSSPSPSRTRTDPPPTTPRDKSSSASISISTPSPRKATDAVTVTLAQRLNDLAQANSDGLLNDDEYRMLRQNLFERFSTTTSVPTESPVVPAARPRPRKAGASDSRPTSQSVSNFQVDLPRPTSIHSSRNSIASNVTDIFRRAAGRRSNSTSYDTSETSSVWSGTSNNTTNNNKFKFPRVLSKKSSSSSVRTTRSQADAVSITSRATGSERDPFSSSRSVTGSIRRAAPPSAFRALGGGDNKYAHSIANIYDEENLKTSAEIKQEILSVEAEARRLMDAFNGLELTALSKMQRHHHGPGRPPPRTPDTAKSQASFLDMGDARSGRRVQLNTDGGDTGSIRSATSTGARSAYSANRRTIRPKTSLNASLTLNSVSRPNSLHRKNSSSSVTSERKSAMRNNSIAPPVPALPASMGHLGIGMGNNSSVSLARSAHVPMTSVPEDGTEIGGDEVEEDYDGEMEDIKQRREEVRLRYDARIEYLGAKLKSAQLHEKLMKK